MSAQYFNGTSGANQYYFNSSNTTTSQSNQNYTSSATPSYGSPTYSSYPVSHSSNQQIRLNDSYQTPQSYQSTGGFGRSINQQQYQSAQSPPPQVRASVRVLGSQDTYQLQSSPQRTQISPQQHHFQFDSHQQPGRPTGPAVVYQTPGAAQFTHHNVDLWTENASRSPDYYVQAQRVSVRPVSTGSPQQSHSISPQRNQDHLQNYYSQLTPEQHQQLLRQQQIQRQQEQNSSYEQQRRVTVQQVSPSSTSHQQQQYASTANFAGGQQGRSRLESDRQRQNEQAQRQMAIQRAERYDDDESSRPVGIRNLMNKFAGISTSSQPRQPRSRSTSSRHYSNSSYASHPTSHQSTTTSSYTSHTMTYSALPKTHEPPVNSVEFLQMQQLLGNSINNIQQAVAPPHIQLAHADPGSVRDRFNTGSLSDDYNRLMMHRQPQPQKQVTRQTSNDGGSTLSSLRNQYMGRTKDSLQGDLPPQPAYNIPRTIVGEDFPPTKQQQQAPLQMQPPPQVFQKQTEPTPQQQPTFEESQPQQQEPQGENVDQQAPETMPPPANEGEFAVSSF
ncbi:unnamed protein product [Adineta ricciae]|uniref:Uncharacterized protein n=1 Tax=Adineta ricciae TaxID=249248 RepID=A0A814FX61_ADIRI|nr:unnamed protein product [Adineta ricciae]